MKYNLSSFLEEVPDTRIKKGQRYSMNQLLSIVIMGIISGEKGIRGFERFAKMSEPELVKALKLKHGVPSYGTFHTLFENLDFANLNSVFMNWSKQYIPKIDHIAIDGKALKSTLKDGTSSSQSFIMLVNAFSVETKMVISQKSFNNGKAHEGKYVLKLLEKLDLSEKTISMDAGLCEKKF